MAQDVWKYCGVSFASFWGFHPYMGLFSFRKLFYDLFINLRSVVAVIVFCLYNQALLTPTSKCLLYPCREHSQHRCYRQHRCYHQHRCCYRHYGSDHWHHCTHHWIPGWSSGLPLHQQAPIPELQAWVILSPTAAGSSTTAASWSRVWGGGWTERERGLWSSTKYWTEAMWSLCACTALIFIM